MQVTKKLLETLQKTPAETHGTSLITFYIQQTDV